MAEREKVIAMLKCIANLETVYVADCKRRECPYAGTDCMMAVAADALALLKEQEARVLSWEEVKKSGSAYRCVEIYSPQVRRLALIYCIVRQSETIPEFYYLLEDSGVSWCRTEAEYNRDCWQGTVSGWRCWTARPAEEQRRTVKWDE